MKFSGIASGNGEPNQIGNAVFFGFGEDVSFAAESSGVTFKEKKMIDEIFVSEATIYEIYCCGCNERTDEHGSADDAIEEAEESGYEVFDDEIFCAKCAEKQ